MEAKKFRKSLRLRSSIFPNVPHFVHFEDSSHLVTDKLESLKPGFTDEEDPSIVWNMWIPYVNPTVVKTVEQAGYKVAKVEKFFFGIRKIFHFQISSREYGQLQGGIWDFADSQREEEDFQHLQGMVRKKKGKENQTQLEHNL